MVNRCLQVIKFSFASVSLVHPVPRYFETLSFIFNKFSCCAIPVTVEVNVFPALAQYQFADAV
ncbi:hypothetical protein D3C86_1910220 [compost metagenome]